MDQDGTPLMDTSISRCHFRCSVAFLGALSSLRSPHHLFQHDISFPDVSNEFDRYKLWCSNVGAAHEGPTYRLSLDYRLREVPAHKKQIGDVLNRIAETLERTASLLEAKSQPFECQDLWDDATEAISDLGSCSSDEAQEDLPEAELGGTLGGNDDFRQRLASIRDLAAVSDLVAIRKTSRSPINPGNLAESQKPMKEIPQLLDTLRFTITCLFRIPVRRPATFDRSKKLASIDLTYFEPFDNSYIADRCPAASAALKERLGRMVALRRRLLHYRTKHYENIKLEVYQSLPEPTKELELLSRLPDFERKENDRPTASEKQSIRPSQISKATTFNPADFPAFSANTLSLDNFSVAESLPSTNPSMWTGNQKLYIPPRPKGLAGGKEFLCPYCFVVCRVSSDEAWKRHVLKDLEPYICTFVDCNMEDHQFENRNDWFEHELDNHRIEWSCNLDGHLSSKSPSEFLSHLQEHHPELQSGFLSQDTIRQFQRPVQNVTSLCPLCSKPSQKIKSHLSRHMEQMALYVLGGNNQEESEPESDASDRARRVDSSSGLGSNDETISGEYQELFEGSITSPTQESALDEQIAVPDATELLWTIPFNLIESIRLTASLVTFLNFAARLVIGNLVYPPEIAREWTGSGVPALFKKTNLSLLQFSEISEVLEKQNRLGSLTHVERNLGMACDLALELCHDMMSEKSFQTNETEGLQEQLLEATIVTPYGSLPGYKGKICDLRSKLLVGVLQPLCDIRSALELVYNEIPEDYGNSIIKRLILDLQHYGPESFLVSIPEDLNVDSNAEPLDDRSEKLHSIQQSPEAVGDGKADDAVNLSTEELALITPQDRAKQTAIINSLGFPAMHLRQKLIAQAHEKTFEWIFELKDGVSFDEWLERGQGFFWISGKPGSGKSTFMKFIWNHPRTMEKLRLWSSKGRLTTSCFYFWNSGTKLQRSLTGLLRTILHDLLSQAPENVKYVFPQEWKNLESQDLAPQVNSYDQKASRAAASNIGLPQRQYFVRTDWEMDTLREAWIRLLLQLDHVCLFIDGLDEFDGDHEFTLDLLRSALSPKVKICLSSRPWNIFVDAFGQFPSLRLQDLTRNDITLYVEKSLGSSLYMKELADRDPVTASALTNAVVEKSAGVFLWVFLVVKSLLRGLANDDPTEMLRRRLDTLPPGLEEYFRHCISRTEPLYRSRASSLFQISRRAYELEGDLCAVGLSLLHLEGQDETSFVSQAPFSCLSREEVAMATRMVERWLTACFGGLLELVTVDLDEATIPMTEKGNRKVQYLHRTVVDFLRTPDVMGLFMSRLNFSPDRTLLSCYILRLRRCFHTPLLDSEFALWARLVIQAMELSYIIEGHTGVSETVLVYELERNISRQAGAPPHKDCKDFLAFATVHGLGKYLETKLGPEHNDGRSSQVQPGCLYLALCCPWKRRSPREVTVEVLLRLGASPNENFGEATVWQKYLALIAEQDSDVDSGHLNIIRMLLRHGADPKAKYVMNGQTKSVSDLIRYCFPKSAEDKELQMLLRGRNGGSIAGSSLRNIVKGIAKSSN